MVQVRAIMPAEDQEEAVAAALALVARGTCEGLETADVQSEIEEYIGRWAEFDEARLLIADDDEGPIGWLGVVPWSAGYATMHTLRWAQPGWPSVAPEGDPVSVGGLLVITAEAGLPETTRSLLLSVPRDVEVHPIRLTELAERFAALGFHYAELIHFIHGAEAGEMGLPEGVALQPLREVDLGALQLCIRDVFSQDASAFFCGGDAAEQESFLRTLEGSQAMREASSVALVRGTELLGFATTAGDSENGNLLIDWMGIRPAFRKQGLARALLRCVLSCAAFEGYRTASLSSDARNEPALSLYQSAGWDVGGGERQFVKQIG